MNKDVDFTPWPEEFAMQYREKGYWQGLPLGDLLRFAAEKFSNNTAVIYGQHQLTYRQLDQKADQLANGLLALGLKMGDRVVVQLPNIAEFLEVIFALFRIGVVPVFALPSHRQLEIEFFCQFSNAKAYFISDTAAGFDYRELARKVVTTTKVKHIIVAGEAAEFLSLKKLYTANPSALTLFAPDPASVALLQLSGGTTSVPKLIPRTHDDYFYSIRESVDICEINSESVYLAVLPIAHNFPMSSPGVLGVLWAGGTIVMAQSGAPDIAFELIEKHKVTITAMVPPLAIAWLNSVKNSNKDLSSLWLMQVGGSKLSAEVARKIVPAFSCKLQQVFGMAEGLVNYTRLSDPDEIVINTQGRPISEADEIRIVDEDDKEVSPGTAGQLITRGPYTIRGYFCADEHNAKAFTRDGFYRTGDIVRMTPEGYLIVEGRAKDQINRGGEKIAAEEVENQLLAHPAVHDAAVVAMPDPYLEERSCAFIVLNKDIGKTTGASELKNFLRERGLAEFKIPDRIELVETFPKTNLGKVSKRSLRNIIAEKLNITNLMPA